MKKDSLIKNIAGFIVLAFIIYAFTIVKFILGIVLVALFVVLEYYQMIGFYGYSIINKKIDSGFKEGTKVFVFTVLCYILFFMFFKVFEITNQTFFSNGFIFEPQELLNFEAYKDIFKSINEPKTYTLLEWIWQKSGLLKEKVFSENFSETTALQNIEKHIQDIPDFGIFNSIKLMYVDFLRSQIPKIPKIIDTLNVTMGFNFWIYNILFSLKIIFIIKVISIGFSRFMKSPKLIRKYISLFELWDYDSRLKDKKNNRIAYFLLIGKGKKPILIITSLIWILACGLSYPLTGWAFFSILGLHLTYIYCIHLILKRKLEARFHYRDYLVFIILLFISYYFLETLIFYYNDYLPLGKLPLSPFIFYFLLTVVVFLYVGLTTTDELQLGKIEATLKQKELELEKQKVQNQLIEESLKRQETENELIKKESSLLKSQLISLKNQIDEHFITNSLSFIGEGVNKISPKLYEAIVKLSDILRYNFEDIITINEKNDQVTKNNFTVPLEKEIEHIKKYLEFNQLRHSNELHFSFEYEGDIPFKKIVKLILITYIENAIKHGDIRNPEHPMIIRLIVEDNTLIFYISNKKLNRKPILTQRESVGNINTKQRLDLAYPNKHELTILDEGNEYTVSLTINLA